METHLLVSGTVLSINLCSGVLGKDNVVSLDYSVYPLTSLCKLEWHGEETVRVPQGVQMKP